jgi:hypothetical protein
LGDHDPSGLDLERDLREKLERYCLRSEVGECRFRWQRLAVVPEDFDAYDLFPLAPKATDTRTRQFHSLGFSQCAELDAIPARDLRDRLEQVILHHIPADEWERLQRIERLEREQWQAMVDALGPGTAA